MLSVVVLGYMAVLDHMFTNKITQFLHQMVAAVLAFNTFFNYAAAVLQDPGFATSTPPPGRDGNGRVLQGAFEDYRFCHQCNKPKPPRAHHCSTCRRCVMGMDHHCPFIANCVGASNLRNFLLFLFWVLVGAVYTVVMSGFLVFKNAMNMRQPLWRNKKTGQLLLDILLALEVYVDTVPWWVVVAWLLIATAAGGIIGVGILFYTQVQQVLTGESYIQSLKKKPVATKKSRMELLQHIFGKDHPITWVLPRWGSPSGTFTQKSL